MDDLWSEEVRPKPPEPDDPAYEQLQDQIARLDDENDRLRAELARVRGERDRLAFLAVEERTDRGQIDSPENDDIIQFVVHVMSVVPGKVGIPARLAAALAEHDRQSAAEAGEPK